MKLPITLLVLVAVSEAAKLENSGVSKNTSKREIDDDTFGKRTELLKKYVPTQSTPGGQYTADDFKQTFQEQSSNPQIFGARLPQITKISDLLTAQGLPFEAALSNHLFSPVSPYHVKFPKFEDKSPNKHFFPNPDIFKKHKHSEEKNNDSQELPLKQDALQDPELFSYLNSDFRPAPDTPSFPFGPGFSGQESPFIETPSSKHFPLLDTQTPFGFRLKGLHHNEPSPYYRPNHYNPENFDFEFDNHKETQDKKEKTKKVNKPQKYEPLQHELQHQHSIPIQIYNAHPNGAISYTSFVNQAYLNKQLESQIQQQQYPQLQEQPLKSDLRQQQIFYVPQLYQPEEQKVAQAQTQHQYQPYHGPAQQQILQYPVAYTEKSPPVQFITIPQAHYKDLYFNANRQHLLQDLQQGAAVQPVDLRQPPLSYNHVPTVTQVESLGQSSTNAPLTYRTVSNYQQLPENQQIQYIEQPGKPEINDGSIIRVFAPTPLPTNYPLSVQPLNSHSTPLEPQVAITPKSQSTHDQIVKPTTVQPDTATNTQNPRLLYQDSNSLHNPQPTIQPVLSSPTTSQSLSSYQPEHYPSTTPQSEVLIGAHQTHTQTTPQHTVQVQQLQLQEIHSKLAPASTEPTQRPQDSTESTPSQQNLSTPQPPETTTDYEIEIASHVDHSQLPKDLRPVTTSQEDTQGQLDHPREVQPHPEDAQHHVQLHHPNHNIHSFDHPSSPYLRPFLGPVQPFIEPRVFPGSQEYIASAGFQQSHIPAYPAVQYIDKFAQPIFGGFQ